MITPHTVRSFSILGVGVLLFLLALMWLGFVPPSMYWTVVLAALALVLMYVTVRLVLQRDRRIHNASDGKQ
jgi:type IV secretory pathway VirB3-like protein